MRCTQTKWSKIVEIVSKNMEARIARCGLKLLVGGWGREGEAIGSQVPTTEKKFLK